MPKKNKIPMRMCIACREMKPKQTLTRVVKSADGEIRLDPTGKMAGRGAYVCSDAACLKKLGDKQLLHKAFSAMVDDSVYSGIREDGVGKE